MAEMVVTDRSGKEHRVTGRAGSSVMETLRDGDFDMAAICGGMCSCAGTLLVQLKIEADEFFNLSTQCILAEWKEIQHAYRLVVLVSKAHYTQDQYRPIPITMLMA